jgi:hypothetical protein
MQSHENGRDARETMRCSTVCSIPKTRRMSTQTFKAARLSKLFQSFVLLFEHVIDPAQVAVQEIKQ